MKKLIRYLDCLVLLAAIIGGCLRLWLNGAALDDKGLYNTGHAAWILLMILSVGTAALLWFVSRRAGNSRQYAANFPKSTVGAITYLLLAIGMGYTGIRDLLSAGDFLAGLTAILGMLSAVMIAVAGIERFGGRRPPFFVHMIPCIYFLLRMVTLGRSFGSEPELCTFLFTFLASVGLIPSFYWLWAFDVGMGNRSRCLFWSLLTAYFCIVSSFDPYGSWVLSLLYGACLITNVCVLKYLPKSGAEAGKKAKSEPVQAPAKAKAVVFDEPSVDSKASLTQDLFVEEPIQQMPFMEELFPENPVQAAPSMENKSALQANVDQNSDMESFLSDIKAFLDS